MCFQVKLVLELAKQTFASRLKINFEIFSKQYQFPFPTLQIKKMKSRWGSMSSRGNMVLNKNLIHTPIECIVYVIIHKLCHLKHKNHGKRFHKLQEKFTPNCKEIKKRLKEFNNEISSLWILINVSKTNNQFKKILKNLQLQV